MREFCRICFGAASLFSIFNESDDERICDKIQLIANVQVSFVLQQIQVRLV